MKGQDRQHLKIQNMYLTVTKEVPDPKKQAPVLEGSGEIHQLI